MRSPVVGPRILDRWIDLLERARERDAKSTHGSGGCGSTSSWALDQERPRRSMEDRLELDLLVQTSKRLYALAQTLRDGEIGPLQHRARSSSRWRRRRGRSYSLA